MAGVAVGGKVGTGGGVAVGADRVGVTTGGGTGVKVGLGVGMGVRVGTRVGTRVGGGLVGGGLVGGGRVGDGGVVGSGVGTAVGRGVGETTTLGKTVGNMTGVSVACKVAVLVNTTPIGTRVAVSPVGVAVMRNCATRVQIPLNQLVLAPTAPHTNTTPVTTHNHHTRNDLRGAGAAIFGAVCGAGEAGITFAGAVTAAGNVATGGLFLTTILPLVSGFTGLLAGLGDGLTAGATGAAAAPITAGLGRACTGSISGAISMGRIGASE